MQHKHATCTDYKHFYTLLHMTHHTHPVRKRTHTQMPIANSNAIVE